VEICVPVFAVNENFITAIVEVPKVHVPELEVTVVDFRRESDEDGESLLAIDDRLRDFDESDETVSDGTGSAVSDLPLINNLEPCAFFTSINRRLASSDTSPWGNQSIVLAWEAVFVLLVLNWWGVLANDGGFDFSSTVSRVVFSAAHGDAAASADLFRVDWSPWCETDHRADFIVHNALLMFHADPVIVTSSKLSVNFLRLSFVIDDRQVPSSSEVLAKCFC